MKRAILLATFMLVLHQTKGQTSATVTCNSNHTVSINISNVDDVEFWSAKDWRASKDIAACEPTLNNDTQTVIYTDLKLPDCAYDSNQKDGKIEYILEISAVKTGGDPNTGQLRTYDHQYYVTCNYNNTGGATGSFQPIKNREANDTKEGAFTFSLDAYEDEGYNDVLSGPVDLDVTIYFKAEVETQSSTPNLDLYPVRCYSSQSANADDTGANFTLISNGCGSNNVSEDLDDTLKYNCTDNSKYEMFSLKTYRYFGAEAGALVYIHCDFRVCLADDTGTACECPDNATSCVGDPSRDISSARRRRSIYDSVDESQLYRVVYGPITLKQEELNKDEVASEDQDEKSQSFQTVAIVGAVCGVVAVSVICATVYLVIRYRSKRTQNGDLHVVT